MLKTHGAYYAMPIGTGYGNAGVPDFLVCHSGRFIGIECKAGKNTTTALQKHHLRQIVEAGGIALVIDENNLHELQTVLENV